MVFCQKCGEEVGKKDSFCPKCGDSQKNLSKNDPKKSANFKATEVDNLLIDGEEIKKSFNNLILTNQRIISKDKLEGETVQDLHYKYIESIKCTTIHQGPGWGYYIGAIVVLIGLALIVLGNSMRLWGVGLLLLGIILVAVSSSSKHESIKIKGHNTELSASVGLDAIKEIRKLQAEYLSKFMR